ncbi:TPA: hypothetical protein ACS7YQ_003856 [Providencia alcalifaciens]
MKEIIILFLSLSFLYLGISNFRRDYKEMAEGEENSLSVILRAASSLLLIATVVAVIAVIIINFFDITFNF